MSVARNIRLLALHNFLEDFTPYSVIGVIYFAQVSGSYAQGMSVLGAVMLFSALLEVPTGIVSDLLGRRRTIIAGSVARLLAVTVYALAGSYEALRAFVRNPRLRYFSVGGMWSFGLGEAAFQFRVVFIEMLWPLWMIGIARLVSHVLAAISYYFAGPLLKRFGEARLLIGGITLAETTILTALLVPSVLSPLFMGFTSIFFGVNSVSLDGLMQREFTDEQRSTMGSLNAFGGSLMFAVMSVALGALADRIGVINALIIATLALFITPPLYLLAFRRPPRDVPVQAVVVDAAAD